MGSSRFSNQKDMSMSTTTGTRASDDLIDAGRQEPDNGLAARSAAKPTTQLAKGAALGVAT